MTARAANFRRDLEATYDFNWWLLGKPDSDCMFAIIKLELSGKTVNGPVLKTTQLSAHAQNHASPERCRKSFTMIFLGDQDIPLIFSHIFTAHAQERPLVNFRLKFWHHHSIPWSRFPYRARNSVRLYVGRSHAGIVSKRRHVARCSLHRWIAKCAQFCTNQEIFPRDDPFPWNFGSKWPTHSWRQRGLTHFAL